MANDRPVLSLVVACQMDNDKPLVQAALFAEKILREEDGVLSAIRIIDHFTITEKPPDNRTAVVQVNLFFAVKSGSIKGDQVFRVRHRKPSGEYGELDNEWATPLMGDRAGANVVIQLTIGVTEYGTHWFDLEWEDQVLTSVPLAFEQGWAEAAQKE